MPEQQETFTGAAGVNGKLIFLCLPAKENSDFLISIFKDIHLDSNVTSRGV